MWRRVTGFHCAHYRWRHILPCLSQPPPAHLAFKSSSPLWPSSASFLTSSLFFWFLVILLANICSSFTIPHFFFLVFLTSWGRAEMLLKMTFGFITAAPGCPHPSLDVGLSHSWAGPGQSGNTSSAQGCGWQGPLPDSGVALAVQEEGQADLRALCSLLAFSYRASGFGSNGVLPWISCQGLARCVGSRDEDRIRLRTPSLVTTGLGSVFITFCALVLITVLPVSTVTVIPFCR